MRKIKVDKDNYIIESIEVEEGGVEFPEDFNYDYQDCYKYIDGEFIFDQEKYEKAVKANNISPLDNIESQVFYTAMMTDTLIEE